MTVGILWQTFQTAILCVRNGIIRQPLHDIG
jgi:hypothetical protein